MPSSVIKAHLQCQVKNALNHDRKRGVYFLVSMFVSESIATKGGISQNMPIKSMFDLVFTCLRDRILKTLDPLCLLTSDLHHVGRCSWEKNALLKQALKKSWHNFKNKRKHGMKESQGPSTLFSPISIANSLQL